MNGYENLCYKCSIQMNYCFYWQPACQAFLCNECFYIFEALSPDLRKTFIQPERLSEKTSKEDAIV